MRILPMHMRFLLLLIVLLTGFLVGCQDAQKSMIKEQFPLMWQGYQQAFISPQGRVVDASFADQRTTSEGQAYALFFALVADDRKRFAQLLDWTQQNLAQGDLGTHLPAWLWGKRADGQWGVIDDNTASDADLWMAYTLIQAGRLWTRPEYTQKGEALAGLITQREVVSIRGHGPLLLPGLKGFGPDAQGCVTFNPSYLPLPVAQFMAFKFGSPWHAMTSQLPNLIEQSAPRGFPADWVYICPDKPVTLPAPNREPDSSYDAIRTYLWIGVASHESPEFRPIKDNLWGMTNFLGTHALPPETVDVLDGATKNVGPVGFSAALLPFLLAQKRQDEYEQQLKRVMDSRQASGLIGSHPVYYDQNLGLFALGFLADYYRFKKNGTLEVSWQ